MACDRPSLTRSRELRLEARYVVTVTGAMTVTVKPATSVT
jgi:hypothetical protein